VPSRQKRQVDGVEKRLNLLFDALNCETLSLDTVKGVTEIAKAMKAGHREHAVRLHTDLLTNSSEEIGPWMSGLKQLLLRPR